MTDAQLLTIAIAVIVPISLPIYSNSRITDAKETMRSDVQALRMEMKAGFEKLSGEIKEV